MTHEKESADFVVKGFEKGPSFATHKGVITMLEKNLHKSS